jgi:hypothetical protein
MTYTVTAPLVLAVDRDGHTHHVYQGGEIDWLSKEQKEHFLSEKLVVEGSGDGDSDEDGPPAKAAPKADWVDYAVAQGADAEEAESLTKQELVDLYGG